MQKQTIDVNGKPYYFEDMTDKQKVLVQHCADLENKIHSARFQLDQLVVAKESFTKMLVEDLSESEDTAEVKAEPTEVA